MDSFRHKWVRFCRGFGWDLAAGPSTAGSKCALIDHRKSACLFASPRLALRQMALLARSLALLCSFLLALPSGWCCIVGAPCCHQRRPVEKPVGQVEPSRYRSCCCHHSPEQKQNDTTPARRPSTPVRVCSCEKAPVVAPEVARLGPDLLVAPLATGADMRLTNAGVQSEICRIFDPPFPSPHISHCVWLC
jgi:hypothetical protein